MNDPQTFLDAFNANWPIPRMGGHQAMLAKKLNVAVSTVSGWRKANHVPDPIKIAIGALYVDLGPIPTTFDQTIKIVHIVQFGEGST